jgi:hypothetical protein
MGPPPSPIAPVAGPFQPPPASPNAAEATLAEPSYSIPNGYGDDRIVLMVKDPWWLHAYWEIQPSTERAARSQLLPQEVAGLSSILRVHDVTDVDFPAQPAHRSFDITLSGLATNWYINTDAPGRSFIVEIGLLTGGGRFLLLARSNRVTAPRFGPSDVIDERWVASDAAFWKLFGVSAGIGIGSSPLTWSRLLQQRLASEAWSSASPAKPSAVRGFWCRVETDLVIHGLTEPKASVLIQGQPVAVRKDGTFSLRLAMPAGTQEVTVEVVSADGRHRRTFTQTVTVGSAGPLGAEHPAPPVPPLDAQIDPRSPGQRST